MPYQPQLFPESPAARNGTNPHAPQTPPEPPPAPPPQSAEYQPAPIWLQRLSLFILVVFCIYLGVIVTALPWLPAVWDHNMFIRAHPQLWAVLKLGPVRGVISGFGLLDIWIGISEAIHYRDQRR
jgi:hypothetical protein